MEVEGGMRVREVRKGMSGRKGVTMRIAFCAGGR